MSTARMTNPEEIDGTPDSPFGPGVAAARPPTARHPGMLLKVRPDRWEVFHGHILPCPGEIHLGGGTSGVILDKASRPVPSRAKAKAEDAGWTVIPLDIMGPGTSYLKKHAERLWLPQWCRTTAGSAAIQIDRDAYVAFWTELIRRGVIAAPSVSVLQSLRASLYRQGRDHQRTKDDDRTRAFFNDVRVIDAELKRRAEAAVAADRDRPTVAEPIVDPDPGDDSPISIEAPPEFVDHTPAVESGESPVDPMPAGTGIRPRKRTGALGGAA